MGVYTDGTLVIPDLVSMNSPVFTGTPAAPTAALDTNTTQLATTSFVQNQRLEQPVSVQKSDVPVKGGVFNGGFEFAPPFVAPTVVSAGVIKYIDGTAAGSDTNDLYGWAVYTGASATSAQYDTLVCHSGKISFKLSSTNTSGTMIAASTSYVTLPALTRNAIPLKVSTKYRLSVWVKTETVGASGVYITMAQYDSAAVVGTAVETNKLSGTNDWTYLSVVFTSDNDAVYGRILLYNFVAGAINNAWFDDITLEEVVEDTTFTGTIPTPVRPTIVGVTTTDNIDQSLDSGWAAASHYVPPVAVDEGATHRQTFTPTKNKVTNIAVKVVTKGSGNWTLLVHDAANTVIASQLVLNAALADATVYTFNVPNLWTTGALHFHIISTVADGSVLCTTHDDLETCSYIQYYAKPTENATIICNGEKISLSTNEDGLLSGAIIDLDKGKYLWKNDFFTTSDINRFANDVYFASAAGKTVAPVVMNGWWNQATFLGGSNLGTEYFTIKVNTLIPTKTVKVTTSCWDHGANTVKLYWSLDGTNWIEFASCGGTNVGGFIDFAGNFAPNIVTFYVKYASASVAAEPATNKFYIEADLDTASVPSIILQPLSTPVQYSDNIYIPATADRVYLQNTKYANDRGVVVPHLEFCATAVPVKAFPLKVDNTGEANPAVRIMTSLCSGSPTIGTGTDDGSGNWILNTGEYIGITGTANTAINLTYQIGTGTTAFTNLTMNRLYLSSNGVANSATKDPSHQFSFYLGMLKEGVHKVVEGVQRAVNDIARDVINYIPWQNWTPTLTWATATPTGVTTEARWMQIGKMVFVSVYVNTTDSKATTGLNLTAPVPAPSTNITYSSLSAFEYYGVTGSTRAPVAYRANGTNIEWITFNAGTDGNRLAIFINGFYEVS